MPRNQPLSSLRQKFKAVCGLELNAATSNSEDERINLLLATEQEWLRGQHLFLLGKRSEDVALTAGERYYDFPESSLDIDRLEHNAITKVGSQSPALRYPVEFGISQENYAQWDSALGQGADPVLRWDLVDVNGSLKIEVWPVPQSNDQTLVLTGIKPLAALTEDTDLADLDDLLIVLFAAAKYQSRRGDKDASATLKQADLHLKSLLGSRQSKFDQFNFNSGSRPAIKPRPIIGVSNV